MNLTSWNTCGRAYVSIAMAAGAGWSNEETRDLLGVWGAADVLRGLPDIPTPSMATLQPPALPPGSILAMLVAE